MPHPHLAEVIQVHAVVGRAEGQQVGARGAELHAAHIRLGVNDRGGRLLANAPQPDCPIITAGRESGGITLRSHVCPRWTGVVLTESRS